MVNATKNTKVLKTLRSGAESGRVAVSRGATNQPALTSIAQAPTTVGFDTLSHRLASPVAPPHSPYAQATG